jgi:hypothetical protein
LFSLIQYDPLNGAVQAWQERRKASILSYAA